LEGGRRVGVGREGARRRPDRQSGFKGSQRGRAGGEEDDADGDTGVAAEGRAESGVEGTVDDDGADVNCEGVETAVS